MGLAPKILRVVFGAVQEMNAQGKTVLLVEQNARAGLRMAGYGVVLETGRVRLTGTGTEVLEHPEIGLLYLGGQPSQQQPSQQQPGQSRAQDPATPGPAA
jgi:branched-chain amino acid transport system ATP-binding protein